VSEKKKELRYGVEVIYPLKWIVVLVGGSFYKRIAEILEDLRGQNLNIMVISFNMKNPK